MRSLAAQQAADEVREIRGPRADELRQRVMIMVALADEHAVGAQPGANEARVLDQNAMQAVELIERERILAGLHDGASPAFQATARRALAFDLEARAAVRQQQKAGRAGNQLTARPADGFGGLLGKPARKEGLEGFGTPDERTVAARSEQVIPDPVPL